MNAEVGVIVVVVDGPPVIETVGTPVSTVNVRDAEGPGLSACVGGLDLKRQVSIRQRVGRKRRGARGERHETDDPTLRLRPWLGGRELERRRRVTCRLRWPSGNRHRRWRWSKSLTAAPTSGSGPILPAETERLRRTCCDQAAPDGLRRSRRAARGSLKDAGVQRRGCRDNRSSARCAVERRHVGAVGAAFGEAVADTRSSSRTGPSLGGSPGCHGSRTSSRELAGRLQLPLPAPTMMAPESGLPCGNGCWKARQGRRRRCRRAPRR